MFRAGIRALFLFPLILVGISNPARGADFDYYILALSWSPAFCHHQAEGKNQEQCGKSRGYRTILHGLWPALTNDRRLVNCDADFPLREKVIQAVRDVTPSPGLIRHEWRKHGTCSGLSPARYFALAERWYRRFVLPPSLRTFSGLRKISASQMKSLILKTNPWLSREAVRIRCQRGEITEFRICLDRKGQARACPASLKVCPVTSPLTIRAPF